MQYYMAVRIGEAVAAKAQERLTHYVPAAYAAMIVKEKGGEWLPVDEADMYAVIPTKDGMFVIALCDPDGYAKAMSNPLIREDADRAVELMQRDGIKEFNGRVILPV